MQNQEKITQAIAAYLDGNNLELFQKIHANRVHSKFVQGQIDYYKLPPNQWPDDCVALKSRREDIEFHDKQTAELIQSIATEITAAIAPHLKAGAGWEDAPEWAEYTAMFDGERYFFEDIFYPCRFVRSGRKTVWKGDFKTQVKNASWDGVIERRPK